MTTAPCPSCCAAVAGATIEGGRNIVYKNEPPLSNVLRGMLDKVGVHVDKLGESTGVAEI